MRRLFSTFAHGAPGFGLLLMRIAASAGLLAHVIPSLAAGPTIATALLHLLAAGSAILLLPGLWTPVAAALAVAYGAWQAFSNPAQAGYFVLLAALAAALALLGPGAWSIDARLFGWKRIEPGNEK